jgi:hypothetical protein
VVEWVVNDVLISEMVNSGTVPIVVIEYDELVKDMSNVEYLQGKFNEI